MDSTLRLQLVLRAASPCDAKPDVSVMQRPEALKRCSPCDTGKTPSTPAYWKMLPELRNKLSCCTAYTHEVFVLPNCGRNATSVGLVTIS